jgi:hypothetical protein
MPGRRARNQRHNGERTLTSPNCLSLGAQPVPDPFEHIEVAHNDVDDGRLNGFAAQPLLSHPPIDGCMSIGANLHHLVGAACGANSPRSSATEYRRRSPVMCRHRVDPSHALCASCGILSGLTGVGC